MKFLGYKDLKMLTNLFNKFLHLVVIPKDLGTGSPVIDIQKCDRRNYIYYQEIQMLNIMAKIYEHILENRLKEIAEL